MTDPDLEIRAEVDHSDPKMGGGGEVGRSLKKDFASAWSESKEGGVGPPGPSPGFATEEGRWLL